MPAKIPHPPQFSKPFLSQAEKLLQRWPRLCGAGVKWRHRRLVLHVAALPLDTKYRPKDLQSLCNRSSTVAFVRGKDCGLPECTRIVAVSGTEPNPYL